MASKKTTEQELKDKLWKMITEINIEAGDDINCHEDYNRWEVAFLSVMQQKTLKVPSFECSALDIQKIRAEVDGSCLTKPCKKSLLNALSAAVKK